VELSSRALRDYLDCMMAASMNNSNRAGTYLMTSIAQLPSGMLVHVKQFALRWSPFR
jgi:hypothetical protein